ILLLLLQLVHSAVAETSQYCRFGHDDGEVDFCVGVSIFHNHSRASHDLYLRLHVTQSSSGKGWNAIGSGPTMAGALMFIVYGDPLSGRDPTVSVRTVTSNSHQSPRPVKAVDTGLANVRLMQSEWLRTKGADEADVFVASVAAVCYGCSRWPGSPIDVSDTSHPWIWAWNDRQHMSRADYAVDAGMEVHNFGAGGWGLFYIDMQRSTGHSASSPQIQPGVAAIGASTFPRETSTFLSNAENASSGITSLLVALGRFGLGLGLGHLHAFFMTTAFLFLFPMGVAAIALGSSSSFRYHWVLQTLASSLAVIGAIVGVIISHRQPFWTSHQVAGIVILLLILMQAVLGLRHHFVFLRIRQRSWVSHAHIWSGRFILVSGLGNIVSGMAMAGHATGAGIWLVLVFMLLGAASLALWICIARRRSRMASPGFPENATGAAAWRLVDASNFGLCDDSDGESPEDSKD
ncbi:uncharacterized protein LY79DRAFT_479275, partial [Colletotrichum navitas]